VVYRTIAVSHGEISFTSTPQTYFVGTNPASVTVADVNGDGIPDMVIADQDSNDVSVLFGSYDANGNWVGTAGPRLKSGGDGPIAVTVVDINGDKIPDLVVTNGGSGTVTLLPGVGQGFFDDRRPQTLFDLGSAIVQPPSFVGNTEVGYVVTADGELVRFDLGDIAEDAEVVFSSQRVLAVEALASGQVVVALAGGAVKVLTPQGDSLSVAADLMPQGGVPELSSSLEILQTSGGQLEALVSSQGSDTVFVFALGGAAKEVGGGSGSDSGSGGQVGGGRGGTTPGSTANDTAATLNQSSSSSGLNSLTSSLLAAGPVSSVGAVSLSVAGTVPGAAISGFIGENATQTETNGKAVLVPIQGNTYSTVAVLDFGAQSDDDSVGGTRRQPELSMRYAVGDTSGLGRFVMGLEEAVGRYRVMEEELFQQDSNPPSNDPWIKDLFHHQAPARLPIRDGRDEKIPLGEGAPGLLLPKLEEVGWREASPSRAPYRDKYFADSLLQSSSVAALEGTDTKALAGLLAGLLLAHAMAANVDETRGRVGRFLHGRQVNRRSGTCLPRSTIDPA
jgi:FG-GAP-like repeat